MQNPILFLDIDGVLNSPSAEMFAMRLMDNPTDDEILERLESEPCAALEAVIQATACDIVITSSWRHTLTVSQLEGYLVRAGVPSAKVVGATITAWSRDKEILTWVEENNVSRWCALDDIGLPEIKRLGKFIQTPFTHAFSQGQVPQVVATLLQCGSVGNAD